jgi:hypothetical protein
MSPAIRYVFKDGPITIKGAKNADPQVIGEALAAIIGEENDESRLPKRVVDSARDPESPLHCHFEWDDAVAAEKHREEQARGLIRSIVADDGSGNEPVRAFLSIADKGGTSYRTIEEIRSSVDLQQRLLAGAERDLEAFTARYRALKEICAIVEKAKVAVKAKRTNNETRAAA